MENEITRCAVCGSLDVQVMAWVDPNTKEVVEIVDTLFETYCPSCDTAGNDAHPEIEIKAETAWEYKIVEGYSEDHLNSLGAVGWEMVSASAMQGECSPRPGNSKGITYSTRCVFKRAVRQ